MGETAVKGVDLGPGSPQQKTVQFHPEMANVLALRSKNLEQGNVLSLTSTFFPP
jgi:hypothetical protein